MAEESEQSITLANDSAYADDPAAKSSGVISALLSMFKKISIGTDLTSQSLTMPDGFEGRDSALERLQSTQLKHSDILLRANEKEDPVERLIQIVQWIFTLGQAFQLKKPLNPVLGEVSTCKFYSNQSADKNKNTGRLNSEEDKKEKNVFYSVAEQLSHHPPISAMYSENKEHGVKMEAHARANVKFLGTAVKLFIYRPPPVMIRLIGFVLEYAGTTEISCSSHPFKAIITFKEKPYLRGKYHAVKGQIVKVNGSKEEKIVKFKGHWNEEVLFEDLRTNKTIKFEAKEYPIAAGVPTYPKIEEETKTSSRRVWQHLKAAQDSSTFSKAKKEVEEEQRRKAKERTENGEEHVTQFFSSKDNDGNLEWKLKPDALESILF